MLSLWMARASGRRAARRRRANGASTWRSTRRGPMRARWCIAIRASPRRWPARICPSPRSITWSPRAAARTSRSPPMRPTARRSLPPCCRGARLAQRLPARQSRPNRHRRRARRRPRIGGRGRGAGRAIRHGATAGRAGSAPGGRNGACRGEVQNLRQSRQPAEAADPNQSPQPNQASAIAGRRSSRLPSLSALSPPEGGESIPLAPA